jgi:hypothetical protein
LAEPWHEDERVCRPGLLDKLDAMTRLVAPRRVPKPSLGRCARLDAVIGMLISQNPCTDILYGIACKFRQSVVGEAMHLVDALAREEHTMNKRILLQLGVSCGLLLLALHGTASAQVIPTAVPEIDAGTATSGLALLAGGALYLIERCRRR